VRGNAISFLQLYHAKENLMLGKQLQRHWITVRINKNKTKVMKLKTDSSQTVTLTIFDKVEDITLA